MTNSSTLAERLATLLAERKNLRVLLGHLRYFLTSRQYNTEREKLEQEIAALITGPLLFTKEERRYNLPNHRSLAECAFRLPLAFSNPNLIGNPTLVWNDEVLPGVSTHDWHRLVKQRLLDVCGPLDDTVTRMFDEYS